MTTHWCHWTYIRTCFNKKKESQWTDIVSSLLLSYVPYLLAHDLNYVFQVMIFFSSCILCIIFNNSVISLCQLIYHVNCWTMKYVKIDSAYKANQYDWLVKTIRFPRFNRRKSRRDWILLSDETIQRFLAIDQFYEERRKHFTSMISACIE